MTLHVDLIHVVLISYPLLTSAGHAVTSIPVMFKIFISTQQFTISQNVSHFVLAQLKSINWNKRGLHLTTWRKLSTLSFNEFLGLISKNSSSPAYFIKLLPSFTHQWCCCLNKFVRQVRKVRKDLKYNTLGQNSHLRPNFQPVIFKDV